MLVLLAGCSTSSSPVTGAADPTPSASASSVVATPSAKTSEPAPATASPAAPAPTGPTPCSTRQLNLALGDQQGAAGTDYQTLVLTNTSTTSCRLGGFPGVSLRDASGQLGASAQHTGPAGAPVLLAPGAQAHAVLSITRAGTYSASDCKPKTSTQVRLYPPGQREFLSAPAEVQGCSSTSTQQLKVSAISEGSTA